MRQQLIWRVALMAIACAGSVSHAAISLSADNAMAMAGAPATISVSYASDSPVSAIQFDVSATTTNVLFTGAARGAAGSDHLVTSHRLSTNTRRIVVYSPTSAPLANGILVTLSYDMRLTAFGPTPVTITNARAADAAGALASVDTVQNGSVILIEEDTDGDSLADSLERRIINFRHTDRFVALTDVQPGDDFDRDGWTNTQEVIRERGDPVDIKAYPEFQMPITASTTAREDVTLTVGYAFSASDGVDAVDVAADPASPITIRGPSGGTELITDIRGAALTFEWQICARPDIGQPVQLTWDVNDVPDNHSVTLARVDTQRSAADSVGTRIDMNSASALTINPGECWRMIFARGLVNFDFVRGWNLVSLPIDPDQPNADAIFADLQRIIFENSRPAPNGTPRLIVPQTLSAKAGIWVYFDEATTLGITGIAPEENAVTLKKGWNLVGFVEEIPVPNTPDVKTTPFFWNASRRRLQRADTGTLSPGLAYFIFARQDTEIAQ